jgi:exoribonuclease R
MRAIADPGNALGRGLASIRSEFQIPEGFPPEVLAAAAEAARRSPARHSDRTDIPFATLDPASSTDLDQAFAIEPSGADLLLRYAIADIGWFIDEGDPVDREAWRRGTTQYLPDGKAGLYPPVLSEGAASLLPDGPRPAVVFSVRVDPEGAVRIDGVERAIVRSRAKLAYDKVSDEDLPAGFAEFARRIQSAEARRGAARVNPPAQELAASGDGRFELLLRPPLQSEIRNAALSLAANLAVADLLAAHRTGLFRIMAEPDERAVLRLRHTAAGLGMDWPAEASLAEFERRLDPADPRQASLILAIQRAGQGASYIPYREGETPWHSAVAATYAHATAPLRRLADRYVVGAALALANGLPVPEAAAEAFEKLPVVMAKADAVGSRIERAAVDLAETVLLKGREGEVFRAVASEVDGRTVRIQLCDLPVVARVSADGAAAGEVLKVRLVEADPERRMLKFEAVG